MLYLIRCFMLWTLNYSGSARLIDHVLIIGTLAVLVIVAVRRRKRKQ